MLSSACRRSHATIASPRALRPGDALHGFVVAAAKPVESQRLTALLLRHERTGAQHVHIDRADSNKAFNVVFKTVPTDSTGVPHILEHTTLCGSAKYPVRDPFFKMLTRSLSTFMNAMTGNDYTMYPFSSQNGRDYENLLSVYLDATFFPKLQYADFRQEGWRLEYTSPKEPDTPLVFKGVVFNEMKGYMSDPGAYYVTRLQQALHPGSSYAHVSGGDPLHILDLTHQQLREFHRRHYSPQNARFFTYGDDLDLPQVLNNIDQTLQLRLRHEHEQHLSPLPLLDIGRSRRLTQPQYIEVAGPVEPMGDPNRQIKATVAFLTNDITDTFTTFAMQVLASLLTADPSAPLHKALIDSQLGTSYAPGTGYSTDGLETSFAAGLQGLATIEDAKTVEKLVLTTLQEVAQTGFPQDRIEGELHQIRLRTQHVSANFGLNMGISMAGAWVHGSNPLDLIDTDDYVRRLEARLHEGPFFEKLIEEQLLKNPHRITFIVKGDPNYAGKQAELEAVKLKQMEEKLSSDDRAKIFMDGVTLVNLQDAKEDLSVLPTLSVDAVALHAERFPLEQKRLGNAPTFVSVQPTNGLTYLRGLLGLRNIPDTLVPFLPLYCSTWSWMGTLTRDRDRFTREVNRYTGGLDLSPFVCSLPSNANDGLLQLFISSMALDKNVPKMIELLDDALRNPSLADHDLLRSLINNNASMLSNSVADAGHSFAQQHASSALTSPMELSEKLTGLTQVEFMERLAKHDDLSIVVDALKTIHGLVLSSDTQMHLMVSAEAVNKSTEHLLTGLVHRDLRASTYTATDHLAVEPLVGTWTKPTRQTYFSLPVQVNFASKAIYTVPYGHTDSGLLQVAAKLLTSAYLHREVREKNGAYGGGASWSDGIFSFYSYRDPSTLKTMKLFDSSIQWLLSNKFTDQEIEESKLSVFGRLDAPTAPSDRGLVQFKHLISDDMREARRQVVRNATRADLLRVAEKYLLPQASTASVIVGGQPSDDLHRKLVGQGWVLR